MPSKKTIIIGGGTFQPIRNHLSLSAPAFGTTAKFLYEELLNTQNSFLYLTKMADNSSNLVTNEDVAILIDKLIKDKEVGTIILNVAFCDYKAKPINGIDSDFHGDRLKTENGDISIDLTPTDKIISKIRIERPDIFLVGFKTTTNKTSEEQFAIALKMMKKTKCNLVLANDTVTRNNMVLTPEETIYGESKNRNDTLSVLVQMINMRNNLSYERTKHIDVPSYSTNEILPESMKKVLSYLIDNKGFIENNGNGFTPGHFCFRHSKNMFFSSQRKANHNFVFEEGMSLVEVSDDLFKVSGKRKASVGARSQWIMLEENPEYDCIIHTHNPLKEKSIIPIKSQKPYQCGSIECGLNTLNGLKEMIPGIKAVFLDKHGANILFKSSIDPSEVIKFIDENILLGEKTK